MNTIFRLIAIIIVLIATSEIMAFMGSILFESERPPVGTDQRGYRGTGMVSIYNLRARDVLIETNQIPSSVPYAGEEGPKANTVYKNVQVLGDVSSGEFTRLMVNMTTWVAPEQGCAACHNVADFAEDSLYTKVVARRMLQMVRHINTNRTAHVGQTGVTCYTCHRGQLVPPNVWFNNPGPQQAGGFAQMPAGQNHPTVAVGVTSLPLDPFTPFLEADDEIRVQGKSALRSQQGPSIKKAEATYALMIHISKGLGVNCDFCHNSRKFADWSQSPPARVTAWHGIQMVRSLNKEYLKPLKDVLPPDRLGPVLGDVPKMNCATCHNGVHKPLFGASMAQEFPDLKEPAAQAASAQ